MPRENRKRGKKNKKRPIEQSGEYQGDISAAEPGPTNEPSWIRSTSESRLVPEIDSEAPFGFVEADVKAYFRTVDVQIREWQDVTHEDSRLDEDVDPNEERRLFFVAALTEMNGKEKQLATDPDCSVILERMAYSMDDFVRRVFMDSLAGSYGLLVRHRFASHVCQTLFTVAKETVSRETRGIFSATPESSDQGELRSLTQLVVDASEEILPMFASLIMDPFASHVIRALLLLLSPNLSASSDDGQSSLRSKKSANWKARQGPMKSVFVDEKAKGKQGLIKSTPPEFHQLARRFVETLKVELDENEVRALAANKVASPGLQMLLEVEANQGMASSPDSLMDRVMVGIITACCNEHNIELEPSDYLNTLLRDPTSSHLLETVVMHSPDNAFAILWSMYFKGKLARLASHPVANFVLAKALERVSAEQLSEACMELSNLWGKLIRSSRTSVLRAIIDRGAILCALETEIWEAVFSAFDLVTAEDRNLLVPCVLHLLPLQEYKTALAANDIKPDQRGLLKTLDRQRDENNVMEPKVQGAILLQSLLRLPDPHNQTVIASIVCLPIEERVKIACNPYGSRVYDVLLESPTVSSKSKRQFVMDFIGHYHILADDRLGSRVVDRCWSFADTYLKEKIGRSLVVHEQLLAGSYYGKFFARSINLSLLQRRPNEWKTLQADRRRLQHQADKLTHSTPTPTISPSDQRSAKRKRHTQPEDEIDAVFTAALGKRTKKAALDELTSSSRAAKDEKSTRNSQNTKGLQDVLGAIRLAPKDRKAVGKRKHH